MFTLVLLGSWNIPISITCICSFKKWFLDLFLVFVCLENYWSIISLQYLLASTALVKWISHTYTYISPPFWTSDSGHCCAWSFIPSATQHVLISYFIHSINNIYAFIVCALFYLAFLLLCSMFMRFIYVFHVGVHSSCSLMCNSIVWIYEHFLILSTNDEHLSSFHSGSAKHMDSCLLHIHLGLELMHHRICGSSSIEGTVKQFPEKITTNILMNSVQGSGASMLLSTRC